MPVRIDKGGHEDVISEIDDFSGLVTRRHHFGLVASREDMSVGDRYRFYLRTRVVHRQDRATPEDFFGVIITHGFLWW
jgi:hypothetical protein